MSTQTAKVRVDNIELDPTEQMLVFTVSFSVGSLSETVKFNDMVGNYRGKTDADVAKMLRGIIQDIIRQRIGRTEEVIGGAWKRAAAFIGQEYVIEIPTG